MKQTPVTIFAGYLGSGKTTIILNALKQFKEPVNFAMIKNEFGDVNVDAALAENSNLAVKDVVNGCLCCVLVGSLNPGIDELLDNQEPERIIIEASGDALPFPIVLELKKNPRVYVDGVIVVVDCENFEKIKDKSVVARDQAKHTDLIILNKVGLVDEDQLYHVKEEVFDINPDTVKLETTDGVMDPHVLFGIPDARERWEKLPEMIDSHDDEEGDHRHEVESFTFKTDKKTDKDKVEEVLKACRPGSFYRIKGIVQIEDGSWQLVNAVFGRLEWRSLPSFDGDMSQIAFIGNNITHWEVPVKEYLDKATV